MKKLLTLIISLLLFSGYTIAQGDAMVLHYNTNLSQGTTIALPLYGNVDVIVVWGDGSTQAINTEGYHEHTYTSEGEYTVTIKGTLSQFGNSGKSCPGVDKLVGVSSFGTLGIQSLNGAFYKAVNLTSVPSRIPNNVIDMECLFCIATSFNGDISGWDVSSVENMNAMFYYATSFNGDISNWNVNRVKIMDEMFSGAISFNGDISRWDVSNVETMIYMFENATSFNGDLSQWDVSKMKTMMGMFKNAISFNGDISQWDMRNVRDMRFMFNKDY